MLVIVPWTLFWERNVFVTGSHAAAHVLLSPWLRGALSGIGVVAIGAGLLDILDLFLQRERRGAESAGTGH